MNTLLTQHLLRIAQSPLATYASEPPWRLTSASEQIVRSLFELLPINEFTIADQVAVHHSATVEPGAILKGPLIVGGGCFIAAGAYLRGGNWLDANCIIGPGAELKSSFVFAGSKLAHFNFVGDSILGEGVNLEAGSIIANYRNERADKQVRARFRGNVVDTGVTKFGALVGDHCRIGANAVLAPGTILARQTVVGRLALIDQE